MTQHPLNDDVVKVLAEMNAAPPVDLNDRAQFEQFRASFDAGVSALRGHVDTSALGTETHDSTVEGPTGNVPIRTYVPDNLAKVPTVMVYFHGGGWNVGTLETLDPELRWFAHRLGFTVVSVDYRLAPEYPYPAAFDDCMAVVRHLVDEGPYERLVVAGDSAGGNLAAAVALQGRSEGIDIAAQLLINPALDASQTGRSYELFSDGYGLTRAAMGFNWSAYLQVPSAVNEPTASPLAAENLEGLPPAVVVTAGRDPLRDDGALYARRLRASGVRCDYLHLPGLMHGFVVMSGRVPAVSDSVEQFLYHLAAVLDERALLR